MEVKVYGLDDQGLIPEIQTACATQHDFLSTNGTTLGLYLTKFPDVKCFGKNGCSTDRKE
jgi:hypothetical protein